MFEERAISGISSYSCIVSATLVALVLQCCFFSDITTINISATAIMTTSPTKVTPIAIPVTDSSVVVTDTDGIGIVMLEEQRVTFSSGLLGSADVICSD